MTEIEAGELRLLLIFAARYALGRQSTAPSLVRQALRTHVHVLGTGDLRQLAADIYRAPVCDELDAWAWRDFAAWATRTADERETTGQ